jgi:hypothetical protein
MSSEQLSPEKGAYIKFLIDDFKDTSEHLRTTDKKMEVPFQIYAILSLFLSTAYIWLNRTTFYPALLAFLLYLAAFFLFHYTSKAWKSRIGYIARMNFLRSEIHYILGTYEEAIKKPLFYISPVTPKEKKPTNMGLNEMMPWILRAFSCFSIMLTSVLAWCYLFTVTDGDSIIWGLFTIVFGIIATLGNWIYLGDQSKLYKSAAYERTDFKTWPSTDTSPEKENSVNTVKYK